MTTNNTEEKYLIIGTGPCGISALRSFTKHGIPVDCAELNASVGGQWDIKNPNSSMYESAHIISSRTVQEYKEFPFPEGTADYPHHSVVGKYLNDFVDKFNLRSHIQFNTKVIDTKRLGENSWEVKLEANGEVKTKIYKGIVVANGVFSLPNIPKFKGEETFTGEIIHSANYKEASIFTGKRVLIVGAGNSGCDIAVDAVHRSKYIDMSVRRGYYFVPKYLFGKPADIVGGKINLPRKIDLKIKKRILKMFTGDPVKYGFPKPEYELFESHPVVNSLIIHHLGHGDLDIMKDIDHINGSTVHFKDGESRDYDLILLATGFKLNYTFIDKENLNWTNNAPKLFMNIFHPEYDDLFILGMVEATGVGFQGRYNQAEIIARYIKNLDKNPSKIQRFIDEKRSNTTSLTNGRNYLKLARMAYYVDKDTYLKKLHGSLEELAL
jgi:hypothetical protein